MARRVRLACPTSTRESLRTVSGVLAAVACEEAQPAETRAGRECSGGAVRKPALLTDCVTQLGQRGQVVAEVPHTAAAASQCQVVKESTEGH